MIIKGTSRGNPKQLAAHLQRADTNERVQILELNSPTDNLEDTFRDWQFLSTGTQGSKGLYHANISPDAGYTMTPEQWERAADVLEEKLGLTAQPRTIILHEKDGREHIHVVWARTDIDTMTLKSDSFNYPAHEEASLALEKEFGHEHVPGKHAKRDREKQPEFPRAETDHAQWQQAERTGIDPAERKEQITALFQQSDNGQAFKAALHEQGYVLAQGDRGYLIVDQYGDHYSLARELKEKTAQINAFMADVPLDTLPPLAEAKAFQREHNSMFDQTPQPETPTPPQPVAAPEEPSHKLTKEERDALEQAVRNRNEQEAQKLKNLQAAEINHLRSVLDLEIRERMADLKAMQKAEADKFFRKPEEHSDDWVKKFADIIKHRWNPAAAEQQRLERQQKIDDMKERHRIERETKLETLKMQRAQDIEDLKERHAQKLREQKARAEEDLARYVREAEAARRMLEEIDRQKRLADEHRRKQDGPEPPKHTR